MTPKYDPAAMDRQYNARAAVPEYAQYFERWRAASARTRVARRCFLDRAYGAAAAEMLDIFPARESRALLIFIHGGYWRSLDKSDFSFLAPAFVDAGVTLALVNYGLAPQTSMHDIVRQNCKAAAWIYRNAADYGADPTKLYVCGHSAGGHLTAMLLAAQWPRFDQGLPAQLLSGGLAISGLYDLEPLRHAPFLKDDIGLDADSATHLSPACLRPATAAPLYVTVGGQESEEFHRQARLIAEHWQSAPVRSVPMPRDNHFSIVDQLGDASSPLFAAALQMMGL